jgi:Outer membrane protein beta-barrel domain
MLHLQWKKTRQSIRVIVIASILLVSTSHFLLAQQKEPFMMDHDDKPYYFGITLSGLSSSFRVSNHPQFLQNDSVLVAEPTNSGGFSLGLSATAKLSNRFEARFNPQLIFTERNIFYKLRYPDFGETQLTKKIESVIVTFPFQFKFNSDRIGNFRVYMLGGVKADIDLASNAGARKAEDIIKIKKSDYGIEAGFGFNFYFQSFILSPEIKISNGLNNVHSRDANLKYSNVLDRIQSRMIVFGIHIEG